MNEFLTDGDMVGSSVVGLSVGSSEGFCVGDFCVTMLKMGNIISNEKKIQESSHKEVYISFYLLSAYQSGTQSAY